MKKIFKFIALAPIILVMALCAFACGSAPELTSISLSIEGATLSNGYYNIDKSDAGYTIKTTLSPSSFDAYDLTWKSSNTNVATVYFNKLKTVGVGETTITATYKNTDGTEVKGTLRVNVNAASALITFPSGSVTTYNGTDQSAKKEFKANEDDGSNYIYSYYDYTTKELLEGNNAKLINAGKYKIICTIKDTDIQSTKDITIQKATLAFAAKEYDDISYGDALPSNQNTIHNVDFEDNLYNENSKPTDEDILDGAHNDILGVGEDGTIGKYIYTTSATKGSKVGTYETSVHFVLSEDLNANVKRNYNLQADITKGSINIIAKNVNVVLAEQEIEYGSSITPNQYVLNEVGKSDNLLTDAEVDYASNIILGAPSFKVGGEVISLNNSGVLDAREDAGYDLCYDNATTSTGNLVINNIVSSKVKVNPREIEILPTANQSKVYGTIDPQVLTYSVTKNGFLAQDKIVPFLYVDYAASGITVDNDGTDAADTTSNPNYNYNINAGAGSYSYAVDNAIDIEGFQNKNYNISLSSSATDVKFNVTPCPIRVQFANVVGNYKDADASGKYTISYFGNTANYSTTITSFVLNGEELVSHDEGAGTYSINSEYLSTNFNNDGVFNIIANKTPNSQTPTNLILDSFYISLRASTDSTNRVSETGDFFAKYKIDEITATAQTGNVALNYSLEYKTTPTLTLNKITLVVTPTKEEDVFSKVYDAKNETGVGFGTAYTLSENVTISDLIEGNDTNLLTLETAEGKYKKYIKEGKTELVDSMASVGRYEVMLNEYALKSGYEHYIIALDTEETYFYTVKPRAVTVTPKEDQSKTYGAGDGELAFEIPDNDLPDGVEIGELTEMSGSLSRVSGENVGEYAITLGTLDLGENYTITFNSEVVNYTIKPRTVYITPVSYSLRYGDEEPSKLNYYEVLATTDGIDQSILVNPTYTGSFVLKEQASDENAVSKIGSHYPVRVDADGSVLSYVICQGDFACNNNYTIEFTSGVTYTVTPREIVINISSQQKEGSQQIETTITELSSSNYSISNLVDSPTCVLKDLTLTANDDNNAYYLVESADPAAPNFTFEVKLGEQDVTHCYTVTIGKNIVYTVNVTVIYLSIVDGTGSSSTIDYTYSGKDFSLDGDKDASQVFTLNIQTEGFTIKDQRNVKFEYSSLVEGSTPINVGSYRVSVSQSNFSLTVKKSSTEEEITFTSLSSDMVVGNCVLSISNVAYLNITKADIVYDPTQLAFDYDTEAGLAYGLEGGLPDLLEEVGESAVFRGVDGNGLTLKRFENELNYKLTPSNDDYTKFDANVSHTLNITIEDANSNNYNPLNINVPLVIIPKKINYADLVFYLSNKGADNQTQTTTYNGYAVTARLAMLSQKDDLESEITAENVSIVNAYYKIQTVFDGDTPMYAYREWNGTSVVGEIQYGKYSAEDNIYKNNTLTLYGDNNYILLDNRALIISQSSGVSPVDAGIYVCISTISTNTNHTLYDTENEQDKGRLLSTACFYEIRRSDNINIVWPEQSFKYTTSFDFDNPQTLEFEYTMPNAFRSYVSFANLKDESGALVEIPSNKVLNIQDYTIDLIVDSPNYYVVKTVQFNVVALTAEIILPNVNSFVYTGESIASFLDDIGAILRNKDNYVENTIYYTSDNEDFGFTILDSDEGDAAKVDGDGVAYSVSNMPKETGEYKIIITYGNTTGSNYYGAAEFDYSIIDRTFTGSITFKNTEMVYNASHTKESVFEYVKQNMFNISDSTLDYKLELYWVASASEYYLIGHDYETEPAIEEFYYYDVYTVVEKMNNDKFKNFFVYAQRTLALVVNFEDDEYLQDRELSALLTISQYALSSSSFAYANTNTSYVYDGYYVYDNLKFEGIGLLPTIFEERGSEFTEGGHTYYSLGNNQYQVKDKLGNEVFTLTYSYYTYNTSDENGVNKQALGDVYPDDDYPIVPNNENEKYLVEYSFSYGSNYNGNNITYDRKAFSIKKTTLIVFSRTSKPTIRYVSGRTQQEYIQTLLDNNVVLFTNKEDNHSTNMNVSYIKGSPSGGTYRNNKGVYIRTFIVNESGTPVTEPINVGNYKLCATLVCLGDYDLSKFFDSIKLSVNASPITYSVSDFVGEKEGNEYKNCFSFEFEIGKANSPFTTANDLLCKADGNDLVEGEDFSTEDGYIAIKKVDAIKIKDIDACFTIYLVDEQNNETLVADNQEFSLGDLAIGNTYYFKIVDNDTDGIVNYEEGRTCFKLVEEITPVE